MYIRRERASTHSLEMSGDEAPAEAPEEVVVKDEPQVPRRAPRHNRGKSTIEAKKMHMLEGGSKNKKNEEESEPSGQSELSEPGEGCGEDSVIVYNDAGTVRESFKPNHRRNKTQY